ncbi:pore membrane protein of 33 kDa [[Candida] railenensis]|uniref:Pore membrane protein of 33 kDa n=1 Tax=[Candida] railenensis TaxID=45579 RepID=A0A9P0VXP3_9ASCO|nr:pore membrane protein of 33 kDa [[Candida] railenensis]
MPPKAATTTKAEGKFKPDTFGSTMVALVKTQQFYWFLGHVFVLVAFFLHNITSFFSKTLFYYKITLLSVLFTYTIVLRQVHFKTFASLKAPNLRANLIKDENFHYFVLALVFFLTSSRLGALSGSIYSFTIFSLFHSLTYFQNNILSSLPISLSSQQALNSKINNFTSSYNETALMIASQSELLLLTSFVFTIPMTPINLLRSPINAILNVIVFGVVVTFIKLRYDQNKYTQHVVSSWDLKISQLLHSPQASMIPQSIKDAYQIQFKGLLSQYLGPISSTNIIRAIGAKDTSSRKQK